MTANQIVQLIAANHTQDVFITECKDGATWNREHLRLDAWAMNRSWKHMVMTGYEVKVSRGDFISDDKWPAYLPLCNQFYFVAPPGVIDKMELPAEAGLYEVSKTGSRLWKRKVAPHRTIEPPAKLLAYALMCRTDKGFDNVDYWRAWLAEKVEHRKLGYEVAKAIREHCERLQEDNDLLAKANLNLEEAKKIVAAMGLNLNCTEIWQIKRRAEELTRKIPDEFRHALNDLSNQLLNLKRELGI